MKNYNKIFGTCLFLAISPPLIANTCISESLLLPVNGNDVTLPKVIIANENVSEIDSSIQDLAKSAQYSLDELSGNLDDSSPFHGLYLTGNATQRNTEDEDKTYLGLEWQVFRRGYFEGQRKAKLASNNALFNAYTLRRNLRNQSLDQSLYQIKRMQNSVIAYFYRQLLTQQTQLTEMHRKRMRAGYATRQVLAQDESTLKSIQDKITLYDSLPQAPVPTTTATLINQIDNLQLAPLVELEKQAIAQSGIEEMQRLSSRQATLTSPRWSDNLSLGIYARRFNDYTNSQGNEVGIEVAIPIDGNLGHSNVVQHRTQLLSLQLTADKTRLREQLASLSQQFQYAQDRVRQLKNDYALSLTKAKLNCAHLRHVVPTLDDTPEKALEQMPVKVLEKQRNILVARLDAYRLLLQIQTKVQPRPGEAWFSIH